LPLPAAGCHERSGVSDGCVEFRRPFRLSAFALVRAGVDGGGVSQRRQGSAAAMRRAGSSYHRLAHWGWSTCQRRTMSWRRSTTISRSLKRPERIARRARAAR